MSALLVPHLMTCAVTPTRSDLVSMTTNAPLKAAAQEFVCLCMCAGADACAPYMSVYTGNALGARAVCNHMLLAIV